MDEKRTSFDQIILNQRIPFTQGNSDQNRRMKKWLRERIEEVKRGDFTGGSFQALELFSGSGNFTEVLSQLELFDEILAVEVSKQAIESLTQKNFPNVIPLRADLYQIGGLKKVIRKSDSLSPNVLVLDPPREGFRQIGKWIDQIETLEWIFYISCDVNHFSNDANQLIKKGWNLIEVQPLDLFPHTPHIELLSILKKKR